MPHVRARELAEAKGWDVNELFKHTEDISFSAVRSLWNKPNQNASAKTLASLAKALGVTIDELLGIARQES